MARHRETIQYVCNVQENLVEKNFKRALNHQKSLKSVTYYNYPVVKERLQVEKEKSWWKIFDHILFSFTNTFS